MFIYRCLAIINTATLLSFVISLVKMAAPHIIQIHLQPLLYKCVHCNLLFNLPTLALFWKLLSSYLHSASIVMASKSIFAFVILLLLLCLFLMKEPSDNCTAYGCLGADVAGNRKMISGLKSKRTTLKGGVGGYGEKSRSWELRKVPSGPDPLHHNGGSPKPEAP